MSSVAGLYGYPGLSTYCATKHAIEAVSSVLRHELVKFDISVVTVQPGDFSKATHLLGMNHNIHTLCFISLYRYYFGLETRELLQVDIPYICMRNFINKKVGNRRN